MKLLGGIKPQSPSVEGKNSEGQTGAKSPLQSPSAPYSAPSPRASAPEPSDKHNVLEDVIIRHEQIVNRTSSRQGKGSK